MDELTFVASLVRDLAWPITGLVALLLILKKLPLVGQFVKAVKYKDLEVTLQAKFEAAREEADKLMTADPSLPNPKFDAKTKILRLAELDPSIAIIEIWRTLEGEIVSLIQHNGLMRALHQLSS